jgi:hypothetical protein
MGEAMPILTDIPVTMAAEEIIESRGRRRIRPEMLQDAEEAIALGQTLWQPRVVYDWFDVRSVDGQSVRVSSKSGAVQETELRVGPKADLLEGAEQVLVTVSTIGPELEQRVHELNSEGQTLRAYMLDNAGVLALGAIGEAVRCLAEETAAEQGWGVSLGLSPGSLVGWPLRGQRELCSLLPLDSIGVELNPHCVLEPHKSTSGIIGLGTAYEAHKVGSACKYCALQNSCWRRREDLS